MMFIKYCKYLKLFFLLFNIFILNSCRGSLLNAHGEVAREEHLLIMIAFFMMLLVVVPVIFMTIYFSFTYRNSNKNQIYKPNWCESTKIEVTVWTIPILIILFLAYLTWHYTHKLEPSKHLISKYRPMEIDVVALDWKWLFIYPDYHIATVNKIVLPINRPIIFHITSNSVMNSFFIPSLGSQVYAMPGMITKLNLVANDLGVYKGLSSNYSGKGFSNMKFIVKSVKDNKDFICWINQVKMSSKVLLNMKDFELISAPNDNYSIEYFSYANLDLFKHIVEQFNEKNIFHYKLLGN